MLPFAITGVLSCALFCWAPTDNARTVGLLEDDSLCCVLIALDEQASLLGPDAAFEPYDVAGLVIAPPLKLIELESSRFRNIKRRMTVRETFRALGVGMLILESRRIEWYFADGTVYAIVIGNSIDDEPRKASRRHERK
jgi:hypothetical protein